MNETVDLAISVLQRNTNRNSRIFRESTSHIKLSVVSQSWSKWNLKMLVLWEVEKPGYPAKNPLNEERTNCKDDIGPNGTLATLVG